MKDYNESLQSYTGALKIDKNRTAAWSGMAEAYIALEDYARASVVSANITELESKKKENWLREGNLLQMQSYYDESIAKYDGALALDPQYKDALYRKGISLLAIGKTSEAIYLLDQIVVKYPNFKNAYNALGLALEADGRYQEALEAYNSSQEIDPRWNQPLINKIHALWAIGKNDEAVKILVRI